MKKSDHYKDWKPWKVEIEFLLAPIYTEEELMTLLFKDTPKQFLADAFADVTSVYVTDNANTMRVSLDLSTCWPEQNTFY